MKYTALTFLLVGFHCTSFSQEKTVKLLLDSTKIYFRYFYNSKHVSSETLNDSTRIVGRKINSDKFYLEKYVNRRKVWTKVCRLELAKDSLRITTREGDKFVRSKKSYYIGVLNDN